jgi:hypothetical protein
MLRVEMNQRREVAAGTKCERSELSEGGWQYRENAEWDIGHRNASFAGRERIVSSPKVEELCFSGVLAIVYQA